MQEKTDQKEVIRVNFILETITSIKYAKICLLTKSVPDKIVSKSRQNSPRQKSPNEI